MTADVYLVIRCDRRDPAGERCDTEHGSPVRVRNHTELRRYLKTRGWRRTRDGRDICPEHPAA